MGLGLGVTFPIFNIVVQAVFDASVLGVATASAQMSRPVGATVGTALLGGLLNYYMATEHLAFTAALTHVFFVGFIIMIGAFIAVLFLPEVHLRHHEPEPPTLEEMAKEFEETYGLQR